MAHGEPTQRPSRGGRRAQAITIVVTAVTVAVATHAVAAIGAIPSDGRFTACYQTSDNVLNRVVVLAEPGEQCPATYARVTWPAQASGGAAGPPGPQGPQGPAGPPGQAGVSRLGQVRVVSRTAEVRSLDQRVVVWCNRRTETAIAAVSTYATSGRRTTFRAPAIPASSPGDLLAGPSSRGAFVRSRGPGRFRGSSRTSPVSEDTTTSFTSATN